MNTKTANYSFDITESNGEKTFVYKKAKLGLRTYFPMLWPGLILAVFLAYKTAASSQLHHTPTEKLSAGMFYFLIYFLFIPALVVIGLNLLRRPGTFTLKQDSIAFNGSNYPYSDIASLYIKSPKGQITNQVDRKSFGFKFAFGGDRVQNIGMGTATTVATATSALATGAGQISEAAGKGIVKSIQAKSHKICFLFGNREITLASGISENQSIQLFKAITDQQ